MRECARVRAIVVNLWIKGAVATHLDVSQRKELRSPLAQMR